MATLRERLDSKRKELSLSWVEFSKALGVTQSAMEEWVYKNARPGQVSQDKINERFPGLLDGLYEDRQQRTPLVPPPPKSGRPEISVEKNKLEIKKEMAKEHIFALSRLLSWFLFEANASERDALRTEIGDEMWEWFMSLTRAMASEASFSIIEDEGHLNRRPKI